MHNAPALIVFHSDPGHGWYAVPVLELDRLGISDKITTYSFISADGQTAYLEEDCDMTRYVDALTAAGERLAPIVDFNSRGDSPIRALRRYPNPKYNARTGWKTEARKCGP